MLAIDSASKWWSRPGGTLPPGLAAIINWLQKWGWLLLAMAILIPVISTSYKPPSYIPKSQRLPFKWLMGQWGQVLKSWIKKASENIDSWKETWHWRQVWNCNGAITHKHSAHHIHMQPQAILVLQVLALMATGVHWLEQAYFDTDSHSISTTTVQHAYHTTLLIL